MRVVIGLIKGVWNDSFETVGNVKGSSPYSFRHNRYLSYL
jgi:hypothetical protein